MNYNLAGQSVIITGAATGLGRSIAEMLLRNEARVHICDIDQAGLESFAKQWPETGVSVVDVSIPSEVSRLFDEANHHLGSVTGLINNVGIAGPIGTIDNMDLESWNLALETNITGTMLCTQKVIPLLRNSGGGSIINMSSVAGRAGFPLRASYCSTKSAIIGLTRSAALDLGPENIRVNAILPGAINTPRLQSVLRARSDQEQRPYADLLLETEKICALQRLLEPEEVASTVAFLLSDGGSGISGQALSVCGGAKI